MTKKTLFYIVSVLALLVLIGVLYQNKVPNSSIQKSSSVTPNKIAPVSGNSVSSATTSKNVLTATESNGTRDAFDGVVLKVKIDPTLYEVQVLDTKTGNPKGNVVVKNSSSLALIIGKDYYFLTTYNLSKNYYEITKSYLSGEPVSPGFQ